MVGKTWFMQQQEARMDGKASEATGDLARAFDDANAAMRRFIEAYDEFEKRQTIDRSIGGLRAVADQWLLLATAKEDAG